MRPVARAEGPPPRPRRPVRSLDRPAQGPCSFGALTAAAVAHIVAAAVYENGVVTPAAVELIASDEPPGRVRLGDGLLRNDPRMASRRW